MERYYSIHGIINFKVDNNAGFLSKVLPFWDIELRDFESKQGVKPDFTVFLGKFKPQNQNCIILDDRFYMKEDYFYCSDSYKGAKWELELSGFEGNNMQIHISANPFGWMLIPESIIIPLIWFKLNQKGHAVVHGSGVAREGKAFIFAGQGAAGKTTIALNLMERGFKLLGDHFVILKNNAVWSFPSPMHIMDFMLTPFVRSRMRLRDKAILNLNRLSHKVTGLEIGTKISPKILFSGLVEDKAKLHSIFLLLPREKFEARKVDKEEFVAHLIPNQKLESLPLIRYMMEYSYLFPRSIMATYWNRYEENLRQSLSTAETLYRADVPLGYDNETLGRINDLVCNC